MNGHSSILPMCTDFEFFERFYRRTMTMIRKFTITLFLIGLLGGIPSLSDRGSNSARAAIDIDVNVFFNDLTPYGEWTNVQAYGAVFIPHHRPHGWRPYTVGHWVFADDCGWTWVSDSDFDRDWEWACYH